MMGRKPRQSGYSQSNQPSRSLRAKIPLGGSVDCPPPGHIAPSAFAHTPHQQAWGPSPEHQAFAQFIPWQTSAVADASNVDPLRALTGQNSSLAPTPTTDNTLDHENGHTISPVINTPSGSTASFHDHGHGQQIGPGIQTFERMQPYSMTGECIGLSAVEIASDEEIGDAIAGIDNRDPQDIANNFTKQPRPEFFVPSRTHTIHFEPNIQDTSPWDPLRSLNTSISAMDVTMQDVSSTLRGPFGRERVGGRKGPLSPLQKQQAGDVRRVRACLRCMINREKVQCLFIPVSTLALIMAQVRSGYPLQHMCNQRAAKVSPALYPCKVPMGRTPAALLPWYRPPESQWSSGSQS